MNIQKFLDDYGKSRQLSGTIMVSQNDTIVANQSFGFSDRCENIKCYTDTQYLIGSVTKQFTAVALLRALYDRAIASGLVKDNLLVAEKRINKYLNEPISNYLPAEHEIWAASMPKWANIVTLHQLLIHSSGIINYTSLPEFKDTFLNPPKMPALVSYFKNNDLDFPIGSKHSYSNSGYLLLGEIIQQISNQTLDAYLEQTFFKPLNMSATFLATKGTVHDLKKINRFKKLARGYEVDIASDKPTIKEVEKYCHMQIPGAAGSMVSTASDLLLWNSALYAGVVLPNFLLDLMQKPHIKMNDSTDESYGYGIEVILNPTLGTIYCHGGSIDGFVARLVYIPSIKLSIACLSNIAKNLEKLEPEINKIKTQLPADINPSEAFKILDAELSKKFPAIITNKDRYFTTEFATSLVQIL
ncbi:MAG: serine hydrolase domain-containing protein [Gammaproteobacteria bacterium]|nr:serine hydrolase domain-containing protein [Gammaproteobacteria bacterium]